VEWQWALVLLIGGLLLLFLMGLPVAFCFIVVDMVGLLLVSGQVGALQFIRSLTSALADFVLVPVPLYILMGEVLLHSELGNDIIDALDKWFGRLPGRLALLCVGLGTLFAAMTGISTATISLMGRIVLPEMEKRGYNSQLSLGTIMGSSSLAVMIPPSALAVLLAAVGQISVGETLMAIIIPGFLMAILFAGYILLRCVLQPSIAPSYVVESTSLRDRFLPSLKYLFPVVFIIFMVIGVILFGIATPAESAATGALGIFIITAIHKRLSWAVVRKSFASTTRLTIQLFLIVAGAAAFSQILTFIGCTEGLINLSKSIALSPVWIIIAMMVVGLILGMFMLVAPILMITIPVFMPIVLALGFNPYWFAVLMMINMEVGVISPPVGVNLFTMKIVAPPHITMGDVYRSSFPFIACDLIVIALVMIFPSLALWLPGLMR
jgi:tripartite ATP-independent transporter DctM subunit